MSHPIAHVGSPSSPTRVIGAGAGRQTVGAFARRDRAAPGRGTGRLAGFTLLEVLLAISLILLLFGGMFVFYEFSLRSRTRTQDAANEARLAGAILAQMAADLERISALNAALRAGQVRRSVTVLGTDAAAAATDSGLSGTADSISFQSARTIPLNRFAEVKVWEQGGFGGGSSSGFGGDIEEVARPPAYDVQEVRWFWTYDPQTGAGSGLYRTVRPAVLEPAVNTGTADPPALGGAGMATEPPDESADAESGEVVNPPPGEDPDAEEEPDPLLVVERIAPEVQWVHLRYYDGSTWSDSFEGGASGPAPRAVEIVIGFAPLLTTEQIEAGETVADRFEQLFAEDSEEPLPPRTYRRVVYLPSAELTGGGGVQVQRR